MSFTEKVFYEWNIGNLAMETKLDHFLRLSGTNYFASKVQVKMALIRDGLWNIVNETETAPNSRTDAILHTKYLSGIYHTLATIILSVEPSVLYLIRDSDDPAVVWEKLADNFKRRCGQINYGKGGDYNPFN